MRRICQNYCRRKVQYWSLVEQNYSFWKIGIEVIWKMGSITEGQRPSDTILPNLDVNWVRLGP